MRADCRSDGRLKAFRRASGHRDRADVLGHPEAFLNSRALCQPAIPAQDIREIRKVEQQIRFEQETIDVLNADWALLTQPSRMQTMADSFEGQLELKPLEPGQIAELDKLPARPVLPVVPDEGLREAMEATGRDMTATGSVKP